MAPLSLLLGVAIMVSLASVSAQPAPSCRTRCGDVEIPYPFGIGTGCAIEKGFEINCNKTASGIEKPFIVDVEVLNISVSNGKTRVLNPISTYCYNATARATEMNTWFFNFFRTPYRFSNIDNKFLVIGCNTLAYMYTNNTLTGSTTCASLCGSPGVLVNNSCCGVGCCQKAIPEGLKEYGIFFQNAYNSSVSNSVMFNPCSYAALVEADTFNFSSDYITTMRLNEANDGRQPLILDWAIGNVTCEMAKKNMTSSACLARNSECVDSTNGPGYRCNCSEGYEGNPYIAGGCTDVDECKQNPNVCTNGATCHNREGGYRCSCPLGRKLDNKNSCNPDINFIIGISIGSIVLVIIIFCTRIICERQKLTNVKKQYFQQQRGLLLFEKMKLDQGLAFTIFTEAELEQATNKFDKSEILGHGGHGTVYKGVIKDIPVAIKKCALIDDRHKREFGKEMLILSQINHKNIVKLLGCCLEVEVPMLVYEFVPNGTLFDLIHGMKRTMHIPFSSLLRIANEAAEGLAFLHSYANPPIRHGDVKSSNILLDENYMAKVSDFGASILAPTDEAQFVTMVQGTCGYLDPEYMQTCRLTDKSDVYSFGVVILEILTGQMAFKLVDHEVQRSLSSSFLLAMKENNLDAILDSRIKGRESIELLRGLAELAKHCLDMCGDNRPSMKEVSEELSRLRKLSKHPWIQGDTETQNFLVGQPTEYFEIEQSTEYPRKDEEIMPMSQSSSYFFR